MIFIGDSGTGKTMLATALAVCACQQGRRVRFTTLAGLANELQEAQSRRELARVVARYARTELVVVDELGYLALPDGAAELVFQVLSERHERGSLIVTTNLPFGEWTKVFPDARLAKAVVDRLTHRAHIIDTGTESWRFRHGLKRKSTRTPGTMTLARAGAASFGLRPTPLRPQLARHHHTHIRQDQQQQQPTLGGATSSHHAGASASHRFQLPAAPRASVRERAASRCPVPLALAVPLDTAPPRRWYRPATEPLPPEPGRLVVSALLARARSRVAAPRRATTDSRRARTRSSATCSGSVTRTVRALRDVDR